MRVKLFLSIGSIFLIIAILSYIVPHIFVRKDIDNASDRLNTYYSGYQKKQNLLSGSWIAERFVQDAAELAAVSQSIVVDKKPLWQLASSALGEDPIITVVQVTDSAGNVAVISAESAIDYTPEWAFDEHQQLWVKIGQNAFLASPLMPGSSNYLLYSKASPKLVFTPFEEKAIHKPYTTNIEHAYQMMLAKESALLEKNELIQKLAPYHEKAAGIMRIDSTFKSAIAYLTEEIFSREPIYNFNEAQSSLFVLYREKGSFVDLMSFATQSAPFVVVGSSLSSIASHIAFALAKPVLLKNSGKFLQAFDSQGQIIDIKELLFEADKVFWNKESYAPSTIPIGQLSFIVLIPEAEKNLIPDLFAQVRKSLVKELSFNLFLLAFLLFVLSIFLLARISKKVTEPITQLALASEEIGEGKFEGLNLPDVNKRYDEVAILSHSFHKMVASLRDREKIRGVLNKVVSKEIASTILGSSIELGGEERTLTMLFSDIRGFTPLSEILPPQTLIALLNTYMTRMCRIIDATHGVVDKFVGDEIMALYGAPLNLENHADKALLAAWMMLEDLRQWNLESQERHPQITVGIGIHTGPAFAGNMGAENRLNYTVVGANVNLAARLCSAAQPMQILISENSYTALAEPHKFRFQKLAPISLKGIEEPVEVYELLDLEKPILQ